MLVIAYISYIIVCLFQGCYINIDEFKSRVDVLSHLVGDGEPSKNVMNQDSS